MNIRWNKYREYFSKKTIILGALLACIGFAAWKGSYLSAEPGKDKECEPIKPRSIREEAGSVFRETEVLRFIQIGGIVNDASCVNHTAVYGVVDIASEEDVRNALAYARSNNLKVSIAAVKHSMGGQAFAKNALVLDMRNFNKVEVNEARSTMHVQSGATWHDIQNMLHPRYAVKAMQSTDIFSVGGSISVNAHGMDHQAGAVENTIRSMRVMLADGSIRELSRTKNAELYNLVVGGYGLFGIILDAELDIVPNDLYESSREIITYDEFPELFEKTIEPDKDIGLMYTHLSTAPGSFLKEGIVYSYRKVPAVESEIPPLGEISSVKMRRLVINLSKYGGVMQALKWWSEKYLESRMESCSISRNQAMGSGEGCLVSRNEPMHDSVPYLKNSLKKETDILHEYFIPRENIIAFIDGLRDVMMRNDTNLLNASIRVVSAERGKITYAPTEAFSVVLYINQKTDREGNEQMQKVTGELIDLSIQNGGGQVLLPYQLHYTKEQLRASYPEIDGFFALKKLYDPRETLTNTWYEKYAPRT